MPIYEYVCQSCEHRFEKLMKIGAEPPPCDECGATDVKKLVSASAFVLKGGGWYKDHYGLKGGKKSEGSGGGEGSGDSAAKKLDKMTAAASKAKSGGDSGSSTTKKTSTKGKA